MATGRGSRGGKGGSVRSGPTSEESSEWAKDAGMTDEKENKRRIRVTIHSLEVMT